MHLLKKESKLMELHADIIVFLYDACFNYSYFDRWAVACNVSDSYNVYLASLFLILYISSVF